MEIGMPYWTLDQLSDYLLNHEYKRIGEGESLVKVGALEGYIYGNSKGKLFAFPIKQNIGWIYHVMITVNSKMEVQ